MHENISKLKFLTYNGHIISANLFNVRISNRITCHVWITLKQYHFCKKKKKITFLEEKYEI